MGLLSRNKGKVWERAVAAMLRPIFGSGVKRGWQARAGTDAADVEGCGPFWTECKHHHRVNVQAALEQACAAAPAGRWPVAVCKDDRRPPLVAMRLDDWLDLVREWKDRAQ